MTSFVIEFLEENNIFFKPKGKNVKKNHVGIQCPLCGEDDGDTHCNINLKTGFFKCWRNGSHSGPFGRLTKLLTGRVYEGRENTHSSIFSTKDKTGVDHLELLESFRQIKNEIGLYPYWNYLLRDRGFGKLDICSVIEKYNLKACLYGEWRDRLIYPIYLNSNLVSWAGRSIKRNPYLPYRELEVDKSVIPPYDCIGNYDNLLGGDICFITEGIFDMMKIDFYTPSNIGATCLFTLQIKGEGQEVLLFNLRKIYKKFGILLDKNTESDAAGLKERLTMFNVEIYEIPRKFKDPGEMAKAHILQWFNGL